MEQPVPSVSQADVLRVARRDFGERLDAALAVLDSYTGNEQARVRLAILKLAKGKVEALNHLAEQARGDYRDVLMWAEYREYSRIRDDEPEDTRRAAVRKDWENYQDWLHR